MANLKQALRGLDAVGDEVNKLEAQITKLELFQAATAKITFAAVLRIAPMIDRFLATNYPKTGLHIISGDLLSAVSNSLLRRTKKGIIIGLAAGFDTHVYIRANVFRKYKDFYQLTDSQVQDLNTAFIAAWKSEAKKYIKEL